MPGLAQDFVDGACVVLRMRAELLAREPVEVTQYAGPNPDIDGSFDAVMPEQELGIRYVATNDRLWADRADWIGAVFPGAEPFPFADLERAISPSRGSAFDVLIIGGNDVQRIAGALRFHNVLLTRQVKIALGSDLGPTRRSLALDAGFDDVFDAVKMEPEVAVARLRAIHRRYALNAALRLAELDEAVVRGRQVASRAKVLGCLATGARLSPQEWKIMFLLLSRHGETVRYGELRNMMRSYYEPPTFEHLKVLVCTLRKKLRPGVTIQVAINQGYRLECAEIAIRAAA